METAMLRHQGAYVARQAFEEWRAVFQSLCGRYTVERDDPGTFSGSVRHGGVYGLSALDLASVENRIDRTQRDARLDGIDRYAVIFQISGRTTVHHNDRTAHMSAGDVIIVDKARPASFVAAPGGTHQLGLLLPRRPLISHLGFEPQGGTCRPAETPAARLLYACAGDALKRDKKPAAPAESYMQQVVFDLVGALFVPESWSGARPTDKLFARVCTIIRDRLAEPELGPREIAANAGISLRYVHKLFTERGLSCLEFIYALRLDHAARLLSRRTRNAQPLSEIAYTCGFRDYTHFARRFRHRFGHPPRAHPRTHLHEADGD
jgi:AraC-like DNA-binding protein